MNAPAPGLYKKLHDIMRCASYIQKDKRNESQKYNYASEAAIKEKLHSLLVEHGVLFVPSSTNIVHQVFTLHGDKTRDVLLTTVTGKATFIDVETGFSLDVDIVGAGSDSNDKGCYKAITGALKYALTGAFLIPTGDDPENEENGKAKPAPVVTKASTTIGKPTVAIVTPAPAAKSAPTLGDMLEKIHVDELNERDYAFVTQTRERYAEYKDRTKMSDKQMNWLKRIYKDHGPEELPPVSAYDNYSGPPAEDDVPF